MDLREHLLDLIRPLTLGDEVVPGVRLTGASTELGLRLTFEARGESIHVEVAPADGTRPNAASTPRLAFAYRSGQGEGKVGSSVGVRLCKGVALLAATNESRVLANIERDAANARRADADGTRIREVRVDRLLESAGAGTERFYTLSPYVGCLIGCRFCYAQERVLLVRRLELLPPTPWGSFVDVRVNAPVVLERELRELPHLPLKFCPIVSDPYHAIEGRYEVTRRCLEVIAKAGEPPATMVLTRSGLVSRDIAELEAIPHAYVGASIPTIDEAVAHHFEPRAASIAKRLETLATFRARGIRTFAVVQPMLPGDVDALADAVAAVAQSVSIDVLHGVQGAASDFADERYAFAADGAWQEARAHELRAALSQRGVLVWSGELPPGISGTGPT